MEHEFLAVFVDETIDQLFVAAGAEGDGAHGLGLAAGEDGRAVHARQNSHLAGDRPDGLEIAPIGPHAGEDGLARHLLLDFDEHGLDLLLFLAR